LRLLEGKGYTSIPRVFPSMDRFSGIPTGLSANMPAGLDFGRVRSAPSAIGRPGVNLPSWIGSIGSKDGGAPHVELRGAADVNLRIEVSADADSVVRKVEQKITARGALRADTGVSMPP
jgi:hypothetical protein